MSQEEATRIAKNSYARAVSQRKQASAAASSDQALAWLEIVGGIALLIGGLAAGWFVGFFLFIVIDGFRRLAA